MSVKEFHERLEETAAQIATLNGELEAAKKDKEQAISTGDAAKAVAANDMMQTLQNPLEKLMITKAALEGKLRIYAQDAPKAAEIRKRIAEELWPQVPKSFSKMQRSLSDISSVITELDQLNGNIWQLLSEHERLVGESITVPVISAGLIPHDLRSLAAIKLPELPEMLELKFHSQEIREAQERLEAAFNEKLAKQKAQLNEWFELANRSWPTCSVCSQDLVCIGGAVNEEREAFDFQFRCERGTGGHVGGAQGFIRIQGGDTSVHLHPIDVPR